MPAVDSLAAACAAALNSEFSLGNLLQDDLVNRQFRHRFLESGVLSLQLLHGLRLVDAQAAVALAPAKVRLVRDPQLLADLGDRVAVAAHDVGLAQLVNNLLRS